MVSKTMLVALGAMAAAANAQVFLSFGFTDLDGIYNETSPGIGQFQANAVDTPSFASSGDVTRVDGFRSVAGSTAQFDTGFVTLPDSSDFQIAMSINVTGASTADGAGSFSITDINGDTISGAIDGEWSTPGFGVHFFNGLLSNVAFNDTGVIDGFESTTGSVVISDLMNELFDGAIQLLFISDTSSFFSQDFRGQATLTEAQIFPAPGALALVGMGGIVATRRRR